MKTSLKSLFVAVIMMMFCLPATAFANPHSHHSNGAHHQQIHHNNHHKPKHHAPPVHQCEMSRSQFSAFISLVQNTTFNSDKKELIQTAARSNSFTVAQVIQTLNLFKFDSDKVDVASSMYHSVCDTKNWYQVYSVFDFKSRVRQLKERIGQ